MVQFLLFSVQVGNSDFGPEKLCREIGEPSSLRSFSAAKEYRFTML